MKTAWAIVSVMVIVLASTLGCGGGNGSEREATVETYGSTGQSSGEIAKSKGGDATLFSKMKDAEVACNNDPDVVEKFGWDLPSMYAECKGRGYREILHENGLKPDMDDYEWIPHQGIATVTNDYAMVQFRFDQQAIDFFKTRFMESPARIPMGMEVGFSVSKSTDYEVFYPLGDVSGINIPDEAGLIKDTGFGDDHESYGAIIRFPHKLKVDTLYTVVFTSKGSSWYEPWDWREVVRKEGNVRLNFQITVYEDILERMIDLHDKGDIELLNLSSSDEEDLGGSFDYFVARGNTFSDLPVSESSEAKICWDGKSGDDVGCTKGFPFKPTKIDQNPPPNEQPSEPIVGNNQPLNPGSPIATVPTPIPTPTPIATPPSAKSDSDLPDFTIDKVILTDKDGNEKYVFTLDEKVYIHFWIENSGGKDWAGDETHLESRAYLSEGEDGRRQLDTIFIQCNNKSRKNGVIFK